MIEPDDLRMLEVYPLPVLAKPPANAFTVGLS